MSSSSSIVRGSVSILTATLLALCVGCSGAAPRGAKDAGIEGSRPISEQDLAKTERGVVEARSAAPMSTAPLPTAPTASAQKSPMQALNQMVTAQALLVSLLLAPLSKDAADAPLARVDTPKTSTPRR